MENKYKFNKNFIPYDEIKENKKEISNIFVPTILSPVFTTISNLETSTHYSYREIKDWNKYIGCNKEKNQKEGNQLWKINITLLKIQNMKIKF